MINLKRAFFVCYPRLSFVQNTKTLPLTLSRFGCTKCKNWVHGKCAKIKRVTARLAMHFVCSKCKGIMEGTMDSIEKLCDEVETVNGFCYLGDRLNASGGCEAAVTARVRIGWVRFRKCGELLLGNRFPLKMKGSLLLLCKISNTVWK